MDAFFARNRLSAYLDGSLSESEASEVEDALQSDPALRADFEAMKRAVGLLRDVGPVRAPPDLHAKIMARVASEPAPGGTLHWLRRPFQRLPMEGLALAAAALLVVLAIQWKPDQPRPTPPPEAEAVASVNDAPQQPAPTPTTSPSPVPDSGAQKSLSLGRTLPVPTKGAPTPDTRATTAPDEPYVPEWERQGSGSEPSDDMVEGSVGLEDALTRGVDQRTAIYYRLTTVDPAALEALAEIAERVGGRMLDARGQISTTAGTLSDEDNLSTVSLVIPPGSLSEVNGALKELGAQTSTPPASGPLHPADQVVIVLDVLYKP